MAVTCTLCAREIADYRPAAHHLAIDAETQADLCPACVAAIMAWRREQLAVLFPTRAAKRLRQGRRPPEPRSR